MQELINKQSGKLGKTMIAGLGKTGYACANFLAQKNIYADIVDSRGTPPYLTELQKNLPDLRLSLGSFPKNLPDDVELLIVSPGVSYKEPFIRNAITEGKRVVSDIELFSYYAEAPVVAITGSNGKSTVTTLIGEIIRAAELKVQVGGNLGTPAVELLLGPRPDFYVLEVSSFQLDLTHYFPVSAAVVMNVTQDHMDRYDSIDEYASSKQKIYRDTKVAIVNKDDPIVLSMDTGEAEIFYFSKNEPEEGEWGLRMLQGERWLCFGRQAMLSATELRISGLHNQINLLAAFALTYAINIPEKAMLEAGRKFQGLPHRCQLINESEGIKWFNDSKATNVGAAIAAINGMYEPIVLIAGGDGKGADFSSLVSAAQNKVRVAILLGRDARKIEEVLRGVIEIVRVNTMKEAVQAASNIAKYGDCVLLAPACASLDMYNSYEERGDDFSNCVRKLLDGAV